MFGIKNIKKGFFPHEFNTMENMQIKYNGPLPDIKYWNVDSMSPEKRQEVTQWWLDKKQELEANNQTYDFIKELREYCSDDVKQTTRLYDLVPHRSTMPLRKT